MYEMTIRLQADSGECLYEQIYSYIKNEIRDGKLLTGERLPSTRSLAEYLQVARSTVDYAYAQLLSEGYIESRPYKGYFVCPVEGILQIESENLQGSGGKRAGNGKSLQSGRGITGIASRKDNLGDSAERVQEKTVENYVVNFSPYAIDMSAFPFSVWRKINKNILNYANSEVFAKGEAQGDFELRTTISRYLHSSRGVNCSPEQIIVGAGNDYLLMLLEKICGRDMNIAMENPTYKRSYRIFKSFGYGIETVDMDESGMQIGPLATSKVNAAYVMPSHQFPTGVVMPIGRRMELLKWANEAEGRYLIEDDYDSEFRYQGKPIPALQASDQYGKVIYMGTFSKAIAPAIRVSFMVLPGELLERYRKNCYFYSCTVSRIDQQILDEFIRDGYFERHLNKMRKIYRAKHELLLENLKPFRKQFQVSGENAGLHLLLTSKKGVKEGELIRQAAEQGVRVYGLSECMVEDAPDSTTVLVGFGGLNSEEIEQGVELLKKAWL